MDDEREGLRNPPTLAVGKKWLADQEAIIRRLEEDRRRSQIEVEQLTQERDNAWAAAEQDRLWRESLLRRITELEAALRELYEEVEMSESVGVCLPNRAPALRAAAVLSTSKEKT